MANHRPNRRKCGSKMGNPAPNASPKTVAVASQTRPGCAKSRQVQDEIRLHRQNSKGRDYRRSRRILRMVPPEALAKAAPRFSQRRIFTAPASSKNDGAQARLMSANNLAKRGITPCAHRILWHRSPRPNDHGGRPITRPRKSIWKKPRKQEIWTSFEAKKLCRQALQLTKTWLTFDVNVQRAQIASAPTRIGAHSNTPL